MQSNLIAAEEFCRHHHIEISFLHTLQEHELAEVIVVHNQDFIDETHLETIEKWRCLHYDLHINFEGIHAISYLLERIKALQNQVTYLRNQLQAREAAPEAEDVSPV